MIKKCMSIVLAAAMVLGLAPVSAAAAAQPEVTVVAAAIDGDYLELGLQINSKDASFQSLGAVLQYNAAAIAPTGWASGLADGALDGATVDAGALAEGENLWHHAVALPTVGMEAGSGQTAFTVVDSASQTGYLYLNAEAPTPLETGLSQTVPEDAVAVETPTESFATEYGLEKVAAAPEQVITVRFRFLDKHTEPDPGTPPEETPLEETPEAAPLKYGLADIGVNVVSDTLTYGLGGRSLAGDSPVGAVSSYFETTDAAPVPVAQWSLLKIKEGTSVKTGGGAADASGFASIVFYDWDDTLLGSIIVPKGDAREAVAAFVTEKSATPEEIAAQSGGQSQYFYDDSNLPVGEKKPFTAKRGYSFGTFPFPAETEGGEPVTESYGVWLDYDSEQLTHYGSQVQGNDVPVPTEAVADFSNVTGDMVVKACYGANPELYTGGGLAELYSTEIVSTERVAGDVFIVRIRVMRENTVNGLTVGVPRLGTPAVRIKMNTGSAEVPVLVNMANKDEVVIETVPSKLIRSYSYSVIDTFGDANWPNLGNASVADGDELGRVENNLTSGGTWTGIGFTGNGYLYHGSLAFVNKLIYPGEDGIIAKAILDDLDLDYSMVKAVPPTDFFKARAAGPLIQKAFNELNQIANETSTKEQYQHLTYKQIQYAITHDGALLTEDIH